VNEFGHLESARRSARWSSSARAPDIVVRRRAIMAEAVKMRVILAQRLRCIVQNPEEL
jgi:hypothetical protein